MRKEGGVELRLFHPPPFRTHTLPSVSEGGFHYIPSFFSFIYVSAHVSERVGEPKVFVNARVDLCPPPLLVKLLIHLLPSCTVIELEKLTETITRPTKFSFFLYSHV